MCNLFTWSCKIFDGFRLKINVCTAIMIPCTSSDPGGVQEEKREPSRRSLVQTKEKLSKQSKMVQQEKRARAQTMKNGREKKGAGSISEKGRVAAKLDNLGLEKSENKNIC